MQCIFFYIDITFPEELLSYGLSEEILKTIFCQACNRQPVSWKLTSIPKVGFYQVLHSFLKKWPLTCKVSKREIALLYMAIDPKLNAKDSRADNTYRFIENLVKTPSDQVMYYGMQEHKVRILQSHVGQCTERLEELSSEYMKLKTQFEESKCKLQRAEKEFRKVTKIR